MTPVQPLAYPHKPRPKCIAIFGAAARMGGAVADYLAYAEPDVSLRLLSSSANKLTAVAKRFQQAETAVADYLDASSLSAGLAGVDALFVVTPSGLDERAAMGNLIAVVRELGSVRHIVRVVGYEPEATLARVPANLVARNGDGTQHFIAKALFEESGLPVTFLNCGATLMDNFAWFSRPIAERDVFVYPPRYVPFVDVRDFSEVAARILMSDDSRHIGQFHTVNNGYDQLESPQVAAMLSDVLRRPISFDGSRESFLREYGPGMDARSPGEAQYRWDFFDMSFPTHCRGRSTTLPNARSAADPTRCARGSWNTVRCSRRGTASASNEPVFDRPQLIDLDPHDVARLQIFTCFSAHPGRSSGQD